MRWIKLLFALTLIILIEKVELKGGRGGGGGGFGKLFGGKKSSLKNAKLKQQKAAARTPTKIVPENEIYKSKYFNRDAPISSKDYGTIFASKGLSKNSYIYNNYYRHHSRQSGIAQFLTNALFFRSGIKIGREMSQYDEWDDEDDKHWRMTTKAPFYENKIPGEFFKLQMPPRERKWIFFIYHKNLKTKLVSFRILDGDFKILFKNFQEQGNSFRYQPSMVQQQHSVSSLSFH